MKQKAGYSKIASLLAGATLMGFVTQSAFALTPSNTTISNTATLSYSVGAVPQTNLPSTTASFVVDQKVDLLVTATGTIPVAVVPGQTGAVTAFTVTNLGNDPQGMNLAAALLASPTVGAAPFNVNNISATGLSVFVDNLTPGQGTVGVYDPGIDTATSIASMAPGSPSQTVFVVSAIPANAVDTNQSVISLTAIAVVPTTLAALTQNTGANTAGVDIVFADGAGAVDAVRDAKSSAYNAYLVKSANLAVTKTVTPICDPVNGGATPANVMNIPGAAVQYAITVVNTGTVAATLTTITDTLAATLAFDGKLISGAGATPATTCTSAGGTSLSATGFGVVTGVGAATTYAAPGAAADAVTAGAVIAGQAITITYSTLAKAAGLVLPVVGATPAGSLAANSFITVYFNAFVQ